MSYLPSPPTPPTHVQPRCSPGQKQHWGQVERMNYGGLSPALVEVGNVILDKSHSEAGHVFCETLGLAFWGRHM
jgi:hypothetical protein